MLGPERAQVQAQVSVQERGLVQVQVRVLALAPGWALVPVQGSVLARAPERGPGLGPVWVPVQAQPRVPALGQELARAREPAALVAGAAVKPE